jgi:hypothetical protein
MEEQNINWQKYGFFILLAIFLGFMAQVFQVNSYLNNEKARNFLKQTDKQSKFFASVVVNFLRILQSHLNSMAQIPAATRLENGVTLTEALAHKQHEFIDFLEAYRFYAGLAYESFLEFRKNMVYWSELPAALLRRAGHELMFIDFELEVEAPRGLLLPGMSVEDTDVLRISRNASLPRQLTNIAVESVKSLFEPLLGFSRFCDNLIGWKKYDSGPEQNQFEVFLSKALSRKSFFRSVSLYNINGYRQGFYSLEGIVEPADNVDEICSYLAEKKINWWGKIRFDQKRNKTFVTLASVIRNKDRKVAGFVLGELDLQPLHDWLEDFSRLTGKKILIADKNTIFHNPEIAPSRDMCVKLLRGVDNKLETCLESAYFKGANGWNIFCRPLAGFYDDGLPAWKLCLIDRSQDKNHLISISSIILVIILAVVAFYVLFYRFRMSES